VFIFIAGHANQSTWTYYTIEKFKWSSAQVGYSLGFVGVMVAIVQGGLIRIVIPKIGQRRAVYFGLAFYSITFALFALATQGWMMYVIMIPSALGGFAGPALQGIITSQVPPNEQGELQGALTSLISLTSIFGPLLMTGLFSYFSKPEAPFYFPGAPFMAAAILTLFSLFFAIRTLQKR
jgi:DHA1 family tetracycline resistance protein-like MFS transporter